MTNKKVILIVVLALIASGLFIYFVAPPLEKTARPPKRLALLINSDLQLASVDGFKVGLKELGYREGIDVVFDLKNPKGDRDLNKKMAVEIVAGRPDLIVSFSTTASKAIQDANKEAQIHMIAGDVGNFKELGIENVQRPGGFLTAVVVDNVPVAPKRMEFLKTLLPGLKKIAVFANPKSVSYDEVKKVYSDGARKLGVTIVWYDVSTKEDVSKALGRLLKDGAEAFQTTPDAAISGNAELIASRLKKVKIPSIDFNIERGISSGYLMVYGVGRFDTGKQTARTVDKVLKGTNPGEIPVEFASLLTFEINATLAKEMGIKMPDSLLLQANKVYNE